MLTRLPAGPGASCEAYSQVLPELGLEAKASLLRLYCDFCPDPEREHQDPDAPANAALHVESRFFEEHGGGGNVWVAVGFAGLPLHAQLTWTLG